MSNANKINTQKLLKFVTNAVHQSTNKLLAGPNGINLEMLRVHTNGALANLQAQGAINNYVVAVNPTTLEIEIKIQPMMSIETINATFTIGEEGISFEVARIIGEDYE